MAERSDEGVRAALVAIAREACARRAEGNGASFYAARYRAGELDGEVAILVAVDVALAALSTPVPEEGLPRGSASAAEGDVLKAALRTIMEDDTAPSHPCGPQEYGHFGSIARDALASAEAGDGVAAALPSPLPSQVDLVAADFFAEDHLVSDLLRERATRARAEGNATALGDALHFEAGAEIIDRVRQALAAERARADNHKADLDETRGDVAEMKWERDEARAETKSETRRADGFASRAFAAEARADRAEEALKPFAEASNGFDYGTKKGVPDRFHILAGLTVGDLRRARTILKETPHDER